MTWMPGRARWRWVLATAALVAVAGAVAWLLAGNVGGGLPAASELLAVPTVSPRATATAEPTTTPTPSPATPPPESRLVAATERNCCFGLR